MSAIPARLRAAFTTPAGLRRILLGSFLTVIAAGGALFAVAIVGEGAALAARESGTADPVAPGVVALVLVALFYAGLAAFLASSCIGAWKLWRVRGILLAGAAAFAVALSGVTGLLPVGALLGLAWVGYLFVALGRAAAAGGGADVVAPSRNSLR